MAEQEDRERAMAKMEAFGHPLRLAILTRLTLVPGGAKELSSELSTSLGKVRYQLNRLRKAGLVELREERQRRGVSERIYQARLQPFSEAEIAHLSSSQREKAVAAILKAILGDALRGLRTGSFSERDDFMVARMPLALDQEGWAQAVDVHRRAQAEISAVEEAARARIEGGAPQVSDAFSCQLLFDAPRPTLAQP